MPPPGSAWPLVATTLTTSRDPSCGDQAIRVAHAGGLTGPDPVFEAGVGTAAGFEIGELPAGVGQERGEPLPVGR